MQRLFYLALSASIVLAAGCTKPPATLAPTKLPEVVVELPVQDMVGDYEEFTGRTEAVNSVDIRAQVTGYLEKVHFADGADVKAGDPLFDIDPSLYKATYEQTVAAVAQAKAHLERVNRDYVRIMKLEAASSQQEKDQIIGDKAESEAAIASAEANMRLAKTNLDYTKIVAKFAGRISRRMVDPHNIVRANDTLLTTLVQLDPIYAAYDVDERTTLHARRLIEEGKMESARLTQVPVEIGLADHDGFPLKGVINFVDNHFDPGTGTLRVRATMANPKQMVSPGMFVRVRVPLGHKKPALLIPEEALGSDQGQKFVFVVNDANEVVYRRVKIGQLYEGLRVIEEGVGVKDRVIVSGLQRVRQGVKVAPVERKHVAPAKAPPESPRPETAPAPAISK